MSNRPCNDPVVAEIHAIRAAMLAECDGSVVELMKRVAIRQQSSDASYNRGTLPKTYGTKR